MNLNWGNLISIVIGQGINDWPSTASGGEIPFLLHGVRARRLSVGCTNVVPYFSGINNHRRLE
jgi:hypothetical protein